MIANCSAVQMSDILVCASVVIVSALTSWKQTRDEQSLDLAAVPLCILDASTVLNIAWQLQTKASVDAHTVSKWETHTEHLWQQGTQCPFQKKCLSTKILFQKIYNISFQIKMASYILVSYSLLTFSARNSLVVLFQVLFSSLGNGFLQSFV